MRLRQPPAVLPPRSCGDRIRAVRGDLGLTQLAVSALLGWRGNSRLASYESGRNMPDLETVWSLAEALGCSAAYLAFGDRDDDVATLPEWCGTTPLPLARRMLPRDPRNLCWGTVGAGGGLAGVAFEHDIVIIERGLGAAGAPHAISRPVGEVVSVGNVARAPSGGIRADSGPLDAKTVIGVIVLVIHTLPGSEKW